MSTANDRLDAIEAALTEVAGWIQGSIETDAHFAANHPALSPFGLRFRQELREARAAQEKPTSTVPKDRYRPIFG
jgi:hypothetical protein